MITGNRKKAKILLAAIVALAYGSTTISAEENRDDIVVGIATGGAGGTYQSMGNDVKDLADETNLSEISFTVHETSGTITNIQKVLNNADTQLAMIQSDALTDRALTPEGIFNGRSISDLRFVAGLHPEEVHILSRRGESKSFKELNGKTVAMPGQSSGTAITLNNLEDLVGIRVNRVELTGEAAIESVLNGDVDAFIYVSGQPVGFISEKMRSLGVKSEELEFIPILDSRVFKDGRYSRGTLSRNKYVFLNSGIQTASVQSVLVTSSYVRNDHPKCIAVGRVAQLLREYEGYLKDKREAHVKWEDVTLKADNPYLKESACLIHTEPPNPEKESPKLKPISRDLVIPSNTN